MKQKTSFRYNHITGGIYCRELRIVPGVAFMLRRGAMLDAIQSLEPGNLLEMGFGTGVFTYEFYLRGFTCRGCEIEEKSVEIANGLFNQKRKIIDFTNISFLPPATEEYDYLAAFEVLEHVEDDDEQLKIWSKHLKSGGKIILSVPAHMHMWSDSDRNVGHIRRYEKEELKLLLKRNGYKIERFYCYGFPLHNLVVPLAKMFVYAPNLKENREKTVIERTKRSGYNKEREFKLRFLTPRPIIYVFTKIQKLFYKYDLGTGYVVVAKKK